MAKVKTVIKRVKTKPSTLSTVELFKYYLQLHNYIAIQPTDAKQSVMEDTVTQAFITLIQLAERLQCLEFIDWEKQDVLQEGVKAVKEKTGLEYSDTVYWLELLQRVADLSLAVRTVEQLGSLNTRQKLFTVEAMEILHIGLELKAQGFDLYENALKQLDNMEVKQ